MKKIYMYLIVTILLMGIAFAGLNVLGKNDATATFSKDDLALLVAHNITNISIGKTTCPPILPVYPQQVSCLSWISNKQKTVGYYLTQDRGFYDINRVYINYTDAERLAILQTTLNKNLNLSIAKFKQVPPVKPIVVAEEGNLTLAKTSAD